jgi:hypothetical protein
VDPLHEARGIITGVLLATVVWAVVAILILVAR